MAADPSEKGIAGRLAAAFVRSKISPLLMLLFLALGVLALGITPKEEDPTIVVEVIDVMIGYPGHTAKEVDERIARPVGSWIKQVADIEHVTSLANDDGALFVVQFYSGIPRDRAISELYDRLLANATALPPGATPPMVKPIGADDVPVLAVTFWSADTDPLVLRRLAQQVGSELEKLPEAFRTEVIGGSHRAVTVEIDARKLAELGFAPDQVSKALQGANLRLPAGRLAGPDGVLKVEVGAFLHNAREVESLVIGSTPLGVVYLRDVARVTDGTAEPDALAAHFERRDGWGARSAVTLALYKIRGTNAGDLTEEALTILKEQCSKLLPASVHYTVTRDSGESARLRVSKLYEHMMIAIAIVVFLLGLALGLREGVITLIIIPVSLALLPLIYHLIGTTINRISLGGMIFSIGILIDNAVVIIENIHRHLSRAKTVTPQVMVEAVREVGDPTILASFAIIGSMIPIAFLTGMTGQLVRALPIGTAIAMAFSLLFAFTFTPYLASYILKKSPHHDTENQDAPPPMSRYRRLLAWLMARPSRTLAVYGLTLALLFGAAYLLYARIAILRVLPQNDMNELAIVLDYPPTTNLTDTFAQAARVAESLKAIPEVTSCQIYAGSGGQLDFQGVIRQYVMRTEPYQAYIVYQIVAEKERHRPQTEIINEIRGVVEANLKGQPVQFIVVEPPAGVPMAAPIVAEVYGPDNAGRLELATRIKAELAADPNVMNVDWSARPGTPTLHFDVDTQQAALHGVVAAQVALAARTMIVGNQDNVTSMPRELEQVPMVVRVGPGQRKNVEDLAAMKFLPLVAGPAVPAGDIGSFHRTEGSYPLLRKDLKPFVQVTAESRHYGPLYAALDASRKLDSATMADGSPIGIHWTDATPAIGKYGIRWDGEWQLTYTSLIRDMGVAMFVVLILIYAMMVAWYQSYLIPLVTMMPIPLVAIGVVPAHAILGVKISTISIMGVIVLAGLMVRNSILIVDFAKQNLEKGQGIKEAVLSAAAARLRPILLTSAAIVFGEGILYFDSFLQALGVTVIGGTIVSTLLTIFIVPLAFYHLMSFLGRRQAATPSDAPVAPQSLSEEERGADS